MTDRQWQAQAPILLIGDIHIGRRPEALWSTFEDLPLRAHEVSPKSAWTAAINYALERKVRAVVLTGDLIDGEAHLIEAYQSVLQSARRLEKAGIPLIAVAGNHDAKLLPRLAAAVPSVVLLGEGGHWESHALEGGGQPVELLGWSFPKSHVRENPLEHPSLQPLLEQPRNGRTRIMIVHGDLDVSSSNYAPMKRAQLEQCDVDAAFLGHIHRPDPLHEPKPMGYLGSLVGLDIAETGAHGPVEVRIDNMGRVHAERIAIAPIRWEHLTIDVTHQDPWTAEMLLVHITKRVEAWAAHQEIHRATRVLALRIRLEGRRSLRAWSSAFASLQSESARMLHIDGIHATVLVESYRDHTGISLDIDRLRQEQTPIGKLAQWLHEGPTVEQLRAAEMKIQQVWNEQGLATPEDVDAQQRLRNAAHRVLERMIVAREQGDVQ